VSGAADAHLDQLSDWKAASPSEPVSYGPSGLALGSELWMVGALEASFKTGAQVDGVASFGMEAQTDGPLDLLGRSLHDLVARTTTSTGTGYDGSASSANGGVGHLHVTAFSGFSQVVVTVQHSTDDAATDPYTDLVTFTTVAGLTSQRLAVAGTVKRYLRASWTKTGTGSITFAAALARR
jgi:hypothetical protein